MKSGLKVGHESVFGWEDDSGSEQRWGDLDGDVSLGCAAWPNRLPGIRPLVVRHPLSVVQSFHDLRFWHHECECHPPLAHLSCLYPQFFMNLIPEIAECDNPLDRSVTYLARWIERGIGLSTSLWTLEDLIERPEALAALASECGGTPSVEGARSIVRTAGVINAADHRKVPTSRREEITTSDILERPLGENLFRLWDRCNKGSRSRGR